LHEIDRAITDNTNINITVNIILYHVLVQLKVDAAVILLLNPESNILEYAYSRGFATNEIKSVSLPVHGCLANQNPSNNNSICVRCLDNNLCPVTNLLNSEGFSNHFGAPLIIRGQIIGVMGLFQRTSRKPETEWYSFLETIATQAAIAVDNTALFNNLQVSNKELAMAYETTLEGWVRALDLRDRETEGHTKRVANMTLVLSKALGIKDSILPHVRRGALLHDIGKMGVSDRILNKIGPLTDEEWDIMKRHPIYAKNLLSPITFLHQAIDIPYYHHEKWDGTGYPQGLAGTAIPLTARIFAVVDVWDALTSDRSYRAAWPIEKAKAYLISESGKYFDPRIVKKFFELGLDSSHKK
jgi:putative nucleotidyltransferase with HDIG domain